MRAMVYRGPYRLRVEEKPRPRIEHPNDAIIRVTLAAICGSDLHLYHGMMPDTRVGHTFGHEFVGVVDEVGPGVENLQVQPGEALVRYSSRIELPPSMDWEGTTYRMERCEKLSRAEGSNKLPLVLHPVAP